MTTKKTVKKAPVKKAAPKPKITKIQQAVDVVIAARKANKDVTRKEIIALIAKKLKCEPLRAAQHYQTAIKRI